jgi:replicative DNA helicase
MADGTRWNVRELMGLTTMYDDTNERLVVERAEQSVLSSAIVHRDIAAVLPTLCAAEDFAAPTHGMIYDAINAVVGSASPLDLTTLGAALHQRGRLITVGGVEYLAQLVEDHVTPANVDAHARIVREAARARRAGVAALRVVNLVAIGAPMEAIDAAATAVPSSAARPGSKALSTVAEAFAAVLENIIAMGGDSGAQVGVTTGLRALDKQVGRLRRGQLIVLGGRPAMGKTALAQVIAWSAQAEEVALAGREIRPPRPVVFVSLEMSEAELVSRDASRLSGVDLMRVISGRMTQSETSRVFDAATALSRQPLKILAGSSKLSLIRAECHREKARSGGITLLVVDYIQLVPPEQRSDNREREVAEVSRGLKLLAGELDCPVIALAQLNRDLERRSDKRPMMADLRESGAVEQDADVIAFVYRDVVYNPATQDRGIAEVIIAKQRSGPTGTVRVGFDGARTSFHDLPGEADDDEGDVFAPVANDPRPSHIRVRSAAQGDGAAIYDATDGLPDDGAPMFPGESGALDLGPQYDDGSERGAA